MQPQQHQQQQQRQQQQPPPFAGFAHVPTFPPQYSAAAVAGQQQQQPQQQHQFQQQPQPQQLAPSPPIAVGASGAAGGLLMPMGVSHPLSGHHAVAPVAAGSVSQSMADSVLSCDDAASHSHNQGGLQRSVGRGGGPAPLVKAAGGPQGAPPPTYQQTAAAMHHQHHQQQQQQQQPHHHQATTPLLQQPSTASGNTTPQSGQSPAGPRLLVQHIPLEVTEAELQNLFEQFGAVESARQVMDRESRLPRGHGFVLFKNTADAAAARAALNGFRMYGKTLRVTFATDRARQSQQQHQQQSSILAMSGDGSSGHFGAASGPGGNAPSLNASASHNNPGNSNAAPGNSASHLRGAPIIAGRSAPPGGESTALNDSMSLSLSHSQQHHAAYGRSALGGSAAYGGGGGAGPSTSPGRSAQPVPGGSAHAAPPPPPYGVASASPGAPAPPQYAAMPRVGQPHQQQQQQQQPPPQYFSVSPQQQQFVPQQPQQPQQWAAALPSFEPGVTSGAPQHGGRA